MLMSKMKNSFDGMRGENQFLRILLMVMAIAIIATSCSAMKKAQIITVVPPTLTETAWVSKTQSSSEYADAWALYIGMLLGNVTPANATLVKDALGSILDEEIYQSVMNVLDEQIYAIRQDRVSMSFEPQKVLRDKANENRFFITGSSIAEGPTGDKVRSTRTYEIELQIKNYKPVLSWINTNTGAARTQDVVDREARKAEQQAEREQKRRS